MRILISCSLILALAGCGGDSMPDISGPKFLKRGAQEPTAPEASDALRPMPRPGTDGASDAPLNALNPTDSSLSSDSLPAENTTTSAGGELGTTIAALGDPTIDGFWLKTPLVTAPTPGRIVYSSTGRSVRVELRPQDKDMELLPWMDADNFNPGYMMRSMHLMPKRGSDPIWEHTQDYWTECEELPLVDLTAEEFVYAPKKVLTSSAA